MDNSPRLPTVAVLVAAVLGVLAGLSYLAREIADVPVLSEIEIGLVAVAFTLAIFGIQGWIGVALEGRRLTPGLTRPRLTDPLSLGIVAASLLLFGDAVALAYGIIQGWGAIELGLLAGVGSLILATLLIFYKEAFVGDEARFDEREDGVPW